MNSRFLAFIFAILAATLVSCSTQSQDGVASTSEPAMTEGVTETPADAWITLLQSKPVAFTTPLPDESWTPIDGTYAKFDPSEPQWWACRRCADYRPAGGIWKLRFDRGTMRIYYNVTGWRSIASYTVSDDKLYLFNDPYCPQEVGEYTWKLEDKWGLEDRVLVLSVIKDSCSIDLRGLNLSDIPWDSCQPPNYMTAASDHWHKAPGCETQLTPPEPAAPSTLNVNVIVHPGDARKFAKQPDVYIDANIEEKLLPEGFTLNYSDDSISYGLNRVLWGEGSFVEVSTELPFSSVGVQIYGDYTIGWARVLFDGQEIWRGDTAAIWAYQGRNGGYIEVSDFEPGSHTLHIESMGFDYRPVTVAFFGFSHEGGVVAEEK
ncbi:MAG: hypothetical protein AB8I58_16920 [Anaerolineales bacterium]